ncbi:MAG: hypothetical protein KAG19_05945 [Methylococcales bacterium]|nr:hypothetical protein [Methylococcales bacterium]
MKMKFLCLSVLLLGLTGCVKDSVNSSSAMDESKTEVKAVQQMGSEGVLFISPISINKDARIRQAIKNECKLEDRLAQSIEQFASKQFAEINTDSSLAQKDAKVLTIEIEQVQGGGGGAWSGAKSVLINGELTQNGKVLGTFSARRYSGGGMFAAYKGTCAILGRCTKTLGKDVAKWLENPEKNSALGDM